MNARQFLKVVAVSALCVVAGGRVAAAAKPEEAAAKPEEVAVKAAEQWLALIDAGKATESWESASGYFKKALPQESWGKSLDAVRKPLGDVITRKLKSVRYTKTLPGAPDGEYVVLQFDTSFTNKKTAVETVTPMLDKDGKWRVSGYFVR